MKKTFKIVNSLLVFALLFSLTAFPVQAKPANNPIFTDTDTDIAQLKPYMSISADGKIVSLIVFLKENLLIPCQRYNQF